MKLLRRFLSVVLSAAAAVFVLAAWGTGKTKAANPSGTSVRIRALALTIPRGVSRYDIRGGGP